MQTTCITGCIAWQCPQRLGKAANRRRGWQNLASEMFRLVSSLCRFPDELAHCYGNKLCHAWCASSFAAKVDASSLCMLRSALQSQPFCRHEQMPDIQQLWAGATRQHIFLQELPVPGRVAYTVWLALQQSTVQTCCLTTYLSPGKQ